MIQESNVNFYPLVYIQIPINIDFIAIFPFPSKRTVKVYIQNNANEEIRTSINKKN